MPINMKHHFSDLWGQWPWHLPRVSTLSILYLQQTIPSFKIWSLYSYSVSSRFSLTLFFFPQLSPLRPPLPMLFLQYKQGQKTSVEKAGSDYSSLQSLTLAFLHLSLIRWPPPPSLNLSLSFVLYHWQRLFLSILWVCWWVSVQVVEVLTGGLCPGEHVLMIPHSGNQGKCLQLVFSCGTALGLDFWCMLDWCLVELG